MLLHPRRFCPNSTTQRIASARSLTPLLLLSSCLLHCSSDDGNGSGEQVPLHANGGAAGAVAEGGSAGGDATGAAPVEAGAGGSTAGAGAGGESSAGTGGSVAAAGSGGMAGAPAMEPFVCPYELDPSGYCFSDVTIGPAEYEPPPEAVGPIDGAPAGQLLEGLFPSTAYGESFPYAVYVPAQYDGSTPATLTMVQDMVHYLSRTEATFNTPQVLDNLIHAGEIPLTIAIFHEPATCTIPGGQPQSYCRDIVYNRASADYAEFVVGELVPHVVATHGVNITDDPSGWLSVGFSAGGAAALGLAYHRPDKFQRVITHNGSFVPAATRIGDATGSEIYLSGLNDSEPRTLRVSLSGSPNDLNNEFGNWLMVNQTMARILDEKGNHYRFTIGDGGHYPPLQGAAVFPDDLRFIWADY